MKPMHPLIASVIGISFTALLSGCNTEGTLDIYNLMHDKAAEKQISHTQTPVTLPLANENYQLPEKFSSQGKLIKTDKFLNDSGTLGLVILKNDKVTYEQYLSGYSQSSLFPTWSVTKSFLSALIGIAIERGDISAVTDPVTQYAPELNTTPYANVTIEQALEMASGLAFDEGYASLDSEVAQLMFSAENSIANQLQQYQTVDHPPGTFNDYKSIDSQVLGLVLMRATNQTIASYAEQHLWQPAGMEHDATWAADQGQLALTFCCTYMTTRDMSRLGLIYLNNGFYNGQQIVPLNWIEKSLNTDKSYLQPGDNPQSLSTWGYGYHWWLPGFGGDHQQDFVAAGVFNQYIYAAPAQNMIFAKQSAPGTYFLNDRGTDHIEMFKDLAIHATSNYFQLKESTTNQCLAVKFQPLIENGHGELTSCDSQHTWWALDSESRLRNKSGGCLDTLNKANDKKIHITACEQLASQSFALNNQQILSTNNRQSITIKERFLIGGYEIKLTDKNTDTIRWQVIQ